MTEKKTDEVPLSEHSVLAADKVPIMHGDSSPFTVHKVSKGPPLAPPHPEPRIPRPEEIKDSQFSVPQLPE